MSGVTRSARPSGAASPVETDFDLPALGAALWRKKWKILGPTLAAALATLIVVQFITPKYLSESRVLIEGRGNMFLRPVTDNAGDGTLADDATVTSQVQLILSRDLARSVIAKLQLGKLPEFDPALKGVSRIEVLLDRLGLVKDPLSMTPQERVLQAYYNRLTVYAVDKSRVIVIDFLSNDPELAARVDNAIADEYLARQRAAKQDQAATAVQWLAGQITSMQKKVVDAEAKVAAFRANSDLLVGLNNTTLPAQQLGDFNAELAAARAQQAGAEAKAKIILQMLRSGREIDASDILNSELIRRLAEQRVTLRAQLAEQSSSLLPQHPRIKELKAQIADLDQQIRGEAASVARSFENDAEIANARVASLTASFDQIKNQAAVADQSGVELRALERDAKSQRDLLESYLARYREATARDSANSLPADARVISQATASNVPAYPKKLPSVLIAAAAMLMLCCGFVLTKELLTVPVGVADAAAVHQAPRIAAWRPGDPGPDSRGPSGSADAPIHAVGDVAGTADVAPSLRAAGAADRRIAVLGAVSDLATGDAAVEIARALAADARVILVGLEPANSGIAALAGDQCAGGLAELVDGTVSFRDIIGKDRLSPLHVIAPGQAPVSRPALLSSPHLAPSFDALGQSYDYVVVDAGMAEGADLEAIGAIASHAILLAETPNAAAVQAARERLIAADFEAVTLVVGAAGGAEAAA
jgi:tyrosine-protein kinase Etk/Wzc